VFVFNAIAETGIGAGARDRIFGWNAGDTIDLSAIDANGAAAGDAFSFIGTSAFTHQAGELRVFTSGSQTVVAGDVDGNGTADFQILVAGTVTLTAADFVL
jgi:hypothetical protein